MALRDEIDRIISRRREKFRLSEADTKRFMNYMTELKKYKV